MEENASGSEDDVREEVPSSTFIKVGDSFESWEDFEAVLQQVAESTNVVYVVKNSKLVSTINMGLKNKKYNEKLKYKWVLLTCKNFGGYVTKSSGLRPNQSTFKLGCESHLILKSNLNRQLLVVEEAVFEHNHVTEKEVTAFYPEVRGLNSLELSNAHKLMKLRVKPSILLQSIYQETGKHLVGQDLVNARHALKVKEREGRSETDDLMHYLERLENDGDFVIVGTDDDGVMQFIFIMHKNMIETFRKFPEVLIADSTYNTNKNKMPLLLINAQNGLGGSECIAYVFLINETVDTYSEVFKQLKDAVGDAIQETKTIIIDHDMSEISSLNAVFPHVNIQLCSFHVSNAFRRRTSEEKEKEAIREVLQKMVYAKDDKTYNDLYASLKCVASPTFMTDYFDKYYHHCPNAWTRRSKSKSPNFGNDTTNRNESMNQKIKAILDRSFEVKEAIIQIRAFIENKLNTMAYRRYLMVAKRAYVAHCADKDVQTILDTCTQFASTYIRAELEEAKKPAVKIVYDTTITNCNCYFANSLLLPCRHIMRLRAKEGLTRFSKDLVHQRWLKSYNMVATGEKSSVNDDGSDDVVSVPYDSNAPDKGKGNLLLIKMPPKLKPKGKAEKYKSGLQLGGEVAELLSICGTAEYERRVCFLKEIIDSWKKGQELAVYRKGPSPSSGEEEDKDKAEENTPQEITPNESAPEENHSERETSADILKLPPSIKYIGNPKECDRTVFSRKPSKLKLPSVASKGRQKVQKNKRLTAIGNKRKISGQPVTNTTRKRVIIRQTVDSESDEAELVELKNQKTKKKQKTRKNLIGSDSDVELDVKSSKIKAVRGAKQDSDTEDLIVTSVPHVAIIHNAPKSPEDIKPTLKYKNKSVGTIHIDLVSDTEPEAMVATEATPQVVPPHPETSQVDFSHLLTDDLDSIMVDMDMDTSGNPLCRCRPQQKTVRRTAGPNAKQPGRQYFVCPSKSCSFWRLAASPKKGLKKDNSQPSVKSMLLSKTSESNISRPTAVKNARSPALLRAERAANITEEDITFNPADGSFNVRSQAKSDQSYKVTATSCDCPDKRLRKVFECKHIIKIKGLLEERDVKSCISCNTGEPSHMCQTCSKKVHAIEPCSVPAPGADEGYGQNRLCKACNANPVVPSRKRASTTVSGLPASQTSRAGRVLVKKRIFSPLK